MAYVGALKGLSNDQRLLAYGLFKQAGTGNCSTARPSFFDPVGGAKWDAWKRHEGMSFDDSKKAYIEFAVSLGFDIGASSVPVSDVAALVVDEAEDEDGIIGGDESRDTTGSKLMGSVQSTLAAVDSVRGFQLGESLFKAASVGDLDALSSILGSDSASINMRDENGQTALSWACDRGQIEAVKLLLTFPSIDVSLRDAGGIRLL